MTWTWTIPQPLHPCDQRRMHARSRAHEWTRCPSQWAMVLVVDWHVHVALDHTIGPAGLPARHTEPELKLTEPKEKS